MPLFIGDYVSKTMHLTTEQHGAYLLLLMAYWKNQGPIHEENIQPICRLNGDSWPSTFTALRSFFSVDEDTKLWTHGRVEEELKKAEIRRKAAVDRGKKGAEVRWGHR